MSSESKASSSSNQQAASTGIKIRHGVLVRTDPVLKVYIEHTLAKERSGDAQINHLRQSYDISVNSEHIFLANPTTPIDAEIIDEGLQQVVAQWMKDNSFAQLDEVSDDE